MIISNWNLFHWCPNKEERKGFFKHSNHEHIFNIIYINLHPIFFQMNMNLLNLNLTFIYSWVSKRMNKDFKNFFYLIFTNNIYMGQI
jgi:hypothetical protein